MAWEPGELKVRNFEALALKLWGFLRLRFGGGGFRFVYFAMSSGTWQQNGFGGVHNTAKEPPSFF